MPVQCAKPLESFRVDFSVHRAQIAGSFGGAGEDWTQAFGYWNVPGVFERAKGGLPRWY